MQRSLTLFLISVLTTEEYIYRERVIKSDELWWGTAAKMSFCVYKPPSASRVFAPGAFLKRPESVGQHQVFLQRTLPCAYIDIHVRLYVCAHVPVFVLGVCVCVVSHVGEDWGRQ